MDSVHTVCRGECRDDTGSMAVQSDEGLQVRLQQTQGLVNLPELLGECHANLDSSTPGRIALRDG